MHHKWTKISDEHPPFHVGPFLVRRYIGAGDQGYRTMFTATVRHNIFMEWVPHGPEGDYKAVTIRPDDEWLRLSDVRKAFEMLHEKLDNCEFHDDVSHQISVEVLEALS